MADRRIWDKDFYWAGRHVTGRFLRSDGSHVASLAHAELSQEPLELCERLEQVPGFEELIKVLVRFDGNGEISDAEIWDD